jgi:hypothetical protein
MHYHYVPQEPDDGLTSYCEKHVPEEELWLTYLCDCERVQCVVCEENDGELAEETQTPATGNGHAGDC